VDNDQVGFQDQSLGMLQALMQSHNQLTLLDMDRASNRFSARCCTGSLLREFQPDEYRQRPFPEAGVSLLETLTPLNNQLKLREALSILQLQLSFSFPREPNVCVHERCAYRPSSWQAPRAFHFKV